jgi:hypothetical protein
MPLDFKKTDPTLYQPKTTPTIVDVPAMTFLAVDGQGDPNTSAAYQTALEILYSLSYAIKMSKHGTPPAGYFDYVVAPLEGLWQSVTGSVNYAHKADFRWTALIRQPEFVTPPVLDQIAVILAKQKPQLDVSAARLVSITEGLCVQALHLGSYDDEPATIAVMERYAIAQGYELDLGERRRHHEIYLSDPRRVAPEKLRTIIRHPVRVSEELA